MSRKQSIQAKYFKLVGVAAIAAIGVIGLIRCVPSDQAVVVDDSVSEKVKEAEAAEEAESLAMKEAHGGDAKKEAKKDAKKEKGHASAQASTHAEPAKSKGKQAAAKHVPENHDAKHDAKHDVEQEVAHVEKPSHAAHAERAPASVGVPAHGAAGSLYIVQVGAFKVKENAEKLTAKLKEAGYPVRLQTITHSKNGELHLVRFEPTPNKAEAQTALDKFETKESMKATLLTVQAGS